MYYALYRKWRPKIFDDVIDQKHITSTLKNEVNFKKVAHSYLFTGPRGTGKTTCARILAKAVNCLNPVNGEPCCECDICKGIDKGTVLDVVELDGASSNSVNDVKILKDEAGFVPSFCKFKVYIIDEVHMLSVSAFNALLKIMEEPPVYVIFVLATTEINKVLPTIVSRCQRFDFKRVCQLEIKKRLIYISEVENFVLLDEAAEKIAVMSGGSVRDAISILDECSVHGRTIDLSLINEIFGLASEDDLLNLLKSIFKFDCYKAISILKEVYENGKEIQSFCLDLANFFRKILILKIGKGNEQLNLKINFFSDVDFEEFLKISEELTLDFINEVLKECLNCIESLKFSIDKKLKFELLIFDLCLKFKNFFNISVKNNRVEKNLDLKKVDVIKQQEGSVSKNSVKCLDVVNSVDKLDLLEQNKLEPLKIWPEILKELKDSLKNEMLSGFLVDSEAFVSGDKLFINFKNPVVGKKVLEKKKDIALIIKNQTGNNYRIFIKKTEDSNYVIKNKNLDNFLNIAKKFKIEVDEN